MLLPVDGTDVLAIVLPRVLERLPHTKALVIDAAVRRPTLDEVFMALTGRPTDDTSATAYEGAISRAEAGNSR